MPVVRYLIPFRQSFDRRGASNLVIAGLVPAIHPTTNCGACYEMDPGNKCRDDSVRATTPGSKFFRAGITTSCLLTLAVVFLATVPAHADGDPKRGAKVYRACGACHSLQPGVHLTGPSLAGLWGKKAASAEGFIRYSKVFKAQDFTWDEHTLDPWLADPAAMVPGNTMTFRGLSDDGHRADLIAFLKLAMAPGGAKAVVDKGLISAEGAAGQVPQDLSAVGPRQQVTRLRHCGDTYFVTTADGTETPYWQMNVRLKVDTSKHGPPPGKPAITGSGMMGDRVSIVFARAAEISATIESECEASPGR